MKADGRVRTIEEMEMKNASETVRSLSCTTCHFHCHIQVTMDLLEA